MTLWHHRDHEDISLECCVKFPSSFLTEQMCNEKVEIKIQAILSICMHAMFFEIQFSFSIFLLIPHFFAYHRFILYYESWCSSLFFYFQSYSNFMIIFHMKILRPFYQFKKKVLLEFSLEFLQPLSYSRKMDTFTVLNLFSRVQRFPTSKRSYKSSSKNLWFSFLGH